MEACHTNGSAAYIRGSTVSINGSGANGSEANGSEANGSEANGSYGSSLRSCSGTSRRAHVAGMAPWSACTCLQRCNMVLPSR